MFSCANWKTHTRNRIDISKNSLSGYAQVLREMAEDNHFVHMIFYNSEPEILQIDEANRRGLDAIFNSLRVVCAERVFVIQTITDDLCTLENDIKKLFTYGSHHDLHLDELLFCRKRGWTHDQCACGECSTSLVLENMPIMANRFPPPVARRRSSSIFSANAEGMPDVVSEIDVQNTGQIQIRVSHPRDRSSHVYTQGAENSNLLIHIPQQVENSSLLNTLGGRLSLSINLNMLFGLFRQLNLEEMDAVAGERINLFPDDLSVIEHDDTYDDFLQNVPVLMSSDEYTNAVRIQSAVEPNQNCSICLQKMTGNSRRLDQLCVRTMCCDNIFHDECLRYYLCVVGPPKCPLCRCDLRTLISSNEQQWGERDEDLIDFMNTMFSQSS